MAVLITGIHGFVGQALYKRLVGVVPVVGITRKNGNLFAGIHALDLVNENGLQTFLKNYAGEKINTIVHLASRTASQGNLEDLTVLYDNAAIAKNIALLAKEFGVDNLIHLSSSSVYPNVDGDFSESSFTDPSKNTDAVYGLSKLNEEVVLDYFCGKVMHVIHLRAAMIHGPGMDGSRIIPVLQKEIAQANSATLFGNGERLLNLVHIDSLVELIHLLIGEPQAGIINVADECISLHELAKRLIAESENRQAIIQLKSEGNRNKFRLNTIKLEKMKKQLQRV